MWRLFPLHNDRFGRKSWVNFPHSQQLEGMTSANVTWLQSFFFLFFRGIGQWGEKSVWLLTFKNVNKLKKVTNNLEFFPCVIQI